MERSYRLLQPKPEGGFDDPVQEPVPKRTRIMTKVACQRCRLKKAKCDGTKPVCSRCAPVEAECVYDDSASLGESKSALAQELKQLQEKLDDANTLLHLMADRVRSDDDDYVRAAVFDYLAGTKRAQDVVQLLRTSSTYPEPLPAGVYVGQTSVPPVPTFDSYDYLAHTDNPIYTSWP